MGKPPARGVLKIPKGGWIVSRHIPDSLESIEIDFRGDLVVTFHDGKKPLDAPKGDPLRVKKGAARRTLVITKSGATLDGEAVAAHTGGCLVQAEGLTQYRQHDYDSSE